MDININSTVSMPKLTMANETAKPVKTGGTSFGDVINEAISKVNDLQLESNQKTEDFISGVSDDIHSVIISGSKADLALQMTLQVRNKVMDAYKEIMNMQI